MQLQLALLLSQLSMSLFSRVCRTFVFLGRFFLVNSLFVCLFIGLFVDLSEERVDMICSKCEQSAINC